MREIAPRLTVSNDIAGFFGSIDLVRRLYSEAEYGDVGIEFLPIPLQRWVFNEVSKIELIDGVHGRLDSAELTEHEKGLFDWLFLKAADVCIPDTFTEKARNNTKVSPMQLFPRVIKIAEQNNRTIYLNVHNTHVDSHIGQYLNMRRTGLRNVQLLIENGPNRGDLQNTLAAIRLLRYPHGEKISGTLDLVHMIVELEHGGLPDFIATKKHWDVMLEVLRREKSYFRRVHLPIGEFKPDSLPINELLLNPGMLKALGDVMNEGEYAMTIENQGNNKFWLAGYREEVERLKMIREPLQKAGIIKLFN